MEFLERLGRAPVVIVAPHGGISARDLLEPPVRPVRSNDLHTAELASRLAERIDASLVANPSLDRNAIDLNRIDEVSARAPGLFEAIAAKVERAVAAHGRAEVIFVHGWHVVQPRCDIGLGARFGDVADAPTERLTVGADYLAERLEPFRSACGRIGVDAAFGDRWPGAHPNNVLQVFRRVSDRAFDGAACRLASHAREGRIEAVQLELGAALRWPGPPREDFIELFARYFGPGEVAAPNSATVIQDPRDAVRDEAPPAFGLRLFDPAAGPGGLGLVAGVGPMPGGRAGGRLLLFPGDQRLVIFTGESRRGPAGCVGALRFDPEDDGLRLRFEGHALAAPDGRAHFRSERAQLAARVAPVSIDLRLHGPRNGFGTASGRVVIEGEARDVEARGFSGSSFGGASGRDEHVAETRLAAVAGAAEGLVLRLREGRAEGRRHPGAGTHGHDVHGTAAWSGPRPGPFTVDLGGPSLLCEPRCHLSWLRTGPGGRCSTVTVGVISCDGGPAGRGGGIFEHVEPLRGTAPGRENSRLPASSKVS